MTTLNDIKAAIKTLGGRDVRELLSWLNFYVNRDTDSLMKQWAKQKKNEPHKGVSAGQRFFSKISEQQELDVNVDVWGLL